MSVRVLDDALVNQIAAGEVVERPASVVKELVENALDAGAKAIRVLLRGGGRTLVKVTDDGSGMDRDDAILCLERHATSKIRTAEDLARVATLGFRGEAIPSIAAVCRFELLTRSHDAEGGTRIRVEGGILQGVAEAGCAPGTEIECRSLFFNVPVRRKFLRTEPTELAHCVETVVRQALGRPDVDFAVVHEGREVLRAPTSDRAGRVRDALGPDATDLLPVDLTRGPYAITGLVSSPRVHRAGHTGATYVYVNGRYVRDAVLNRALAEAYAHLVPKGRHPLVVLDLRLDPERVDVNVHPSKIEVRFREPAEVQAAVAEAVRRALQGEGIRGVYRPVPGVVARVSADQAPLPLPAHPDDDATLAPVRRPLEAPPGAMDERPTWASIPRPVATPAPAPEPDPFAPRRLVGVASARWIVVDEGDGIAIYDGKAAVAEVLRARLLAGEGRSERLLTPRLVELRRAEADALEKADDALRALGIDVARVGPGEVVVRAVPAALPDVDPKALVANVAFMLWAGGTPEVLPHIVAEHAAAFTDVEPTVPVDPDAPAVRLSWEDLDQRIRRV